MLYNTSTFLTTVKENMGINNLPLPVDDNALLDRLSRSTLLEFSVRSPYIKRVRIGDNDRIKDEDDVMRRSIGMVYIIPKHYYLGTMICGVYKLDTARPQGYSDLYVPQGMWADPMSALTAIADIKIAATVASVMGKAPTFHFETPDRLEIFNGWSSGVYEVEIGLVHDISLATIPATAFTNIIELAQLDLQWFLYNKLSRVDNLEVGIGTINLDISKWEGSQQAFRDLIKQWDTDGAFLDLANITYF